MNIMGIDLHSNRFTVARMSLKEGDTEMKVRTHLLSGPSWDRFLATLEPEDYVLIENSTNAFWFHDQIRDRVKRCLIYDTAESRQGGNKTDKLDARLLCRKLAYYVVMGEQEVDLATVYVPNKKIRHLRGLFTTYRLYQVQRVQMKNRFHSILKQNGICLNRQDLDRADIAERIEQVPIAEAWKVQLRSILRQIHAAAGEQQTIKETILVYGQQLFDKEIKLLLSIRGFSPFTAIALMSEIGELGRFKNARHFCSYLRTAPKVSSSNQREHIGSINRRSRALTCTLLTQSVIQFAQAGEHLEQFYQRVKVGKSAGKARMALIRKVLVSVYHMLKKEQPFWWMEAALYSRKLKEWEKEQAKLSEHINLLEEDAA